jgi:hypothetical protein
MDQSPSRMDRSAFVVRGANGNAYRYALSHVNDNRDGNQKSGASGHKSAHWDGDGYRDVCGHADKYGHCNENVNGLTDSDENHFTYYDPLKLAHADSDANPDASAKPYSNDRPGANGDGLTIGDTFTSTHRDSGRIGI